MFTILIAQTLTSGGTVANAIDGVRKAELIINGESYVFPIGDNDGRDKDIYYLKRYLEADDKVAFDMFMAGNEERQFFIGDDFPVWLKVLKDGSMTVTKP